MWFVGWMIYLGRQEMEDLQKYIISMKEFDTTVQGHPVEMENLTCVRFKKLLQQHHRRLQVCKLLVFADLVCIYELG